MTTIPERIDNIMRRHDISQVQLGRITGVGTRTVQYWLHGRDGWLMHPTTATRRLLRLLDDGEIGDAVLSKLRQMEDET